MKSPLGNLALALAASCSAAAQPISVTYTPPASPNPLRSAFVDWDSLPFQPTPAGFMARVFDNPTSTFEKFTLHLTTLKPGLASHPPHHHPWEEMLLIKEGDVEISINGQKHRAGPGALIFYASHDAHNLTNVGTTLATYYVINFYTPIVHTVRDQPAAQWAPPGKLPSCVIDCGRIPAKPTSAGSRRDVVDSSTLTFQRFESHITTLNPGASLPPHLRDPADEIFILLSGVVEGKVNGIACRAKAGSFFFIAANDERCIRNIGPDPASYQVIKVVSDRIP